MISRKSALVILLPIALCAGSAGCTTAIKALAGVLGKHQRIVRHLKGVGVDDPAFAEALKRIYVVCRTRKPKKVPSVLAGGDIGFPRHASGFLRAALFEQLWTPYSRAAAYQTSYNDTVPRWLSKLKPSSSLWVTPSSVTGAKHAETTTESYYDYKTKKTKTKKKTVYVYTAQAHLRYAFYAEPGHKPLKQGVVQAAVSASRSSGSQDIAVFLHLSAPALMSQFAYRLADELYIAGTRRARFVYQGDKSDPDMKTAFEKTEHRLYDEAVPLWKKSIEEHPESWEPYWDLGIDRECRYEWEQALGYYEKALARVREKKEKEMIARAVDQLNVLLGRPSASGAPQQAPRDAQLEQQIRWMTQLHAKSERKQKKGIKRLNKQSEWIRKNPGYSESRKKAMLVYNDALIAMMRRFSGMTKEQAAAETEALYKEYRQTLLKEDRKDMAAKGFEMETTDPRAEQEALYMAGLHAKSKRKQRKAAERFQKQNEVIRERDDLTGGQKAAMTAYDDSLIALVAEFPSLDRKQVYAKTKKLYTGYKRSLDAAERANLPGRQADLTIQDEKPSIDVEKTNRRRTAWKAEAEPFRTEPLPGWFAERWAVLPFDSEALDLESYDRPREMTHAWLKAGEYDVLPLDKLDEELRYAGVTQGGQLKAYTPEELSKKLGARWLVYGQVHEFKTVNLGMYVRPKVDFTLRIVDGKTGETVHRTSYEGGQKLVINPVDGAVMFVVGKLADHARKMKGSQLIAETMEATEKHLETLPFLSRP